MSSSDTLVVAVDEERIMRYQRNTASGHISHFDELAMSGITAAAADVTGDFLVTVNHDYYVRVHTVGASISEGNMVEISSFAITGGSSLIKKPIYVAVSPNNVGIYIEGRNAEIVLLDSSDGSGGAVTLGSSYAVEVDPGDYTFVTTHPDGMFLYCLAKGTGKLSEYSRDSGGALSLACSVDTGAIDEYNTILAYGSFVFVADGASIHTYEQIQLLLRHPRPLLHQPNPGANHASSDHASPDPCTDHASSHRASPDACANHASSDHAKSNHASPDPCADHTSSYHASPDHASPDLSCSDPCAESGSNARCDVEKLLDEHTLSIFGNESATCEWSADSRTAVVFYDEAFDPLVAGVNITLAGRYILGETSIALIGVEYTTGTVVLEERTTAPELLQAQLTDDGAAIVVSFSPEGSASSGLIDAGDAASGSGPGPCYALLNATSIPPLGHGASCEWTDGRELRIHLGYEAYIEPGTSHTAANSSAPCQELLSCITLLDGGVRTEAFAVVGLCGSLRLDGRTSSGGSSRTLSTFWNVSSPLSTSASADALSVVKSSLAAFDGSLLAELNATVLAIGVEYTFSLAVESFLGKADEATATVTRIGEDIPSVSILGSPARSVTRGRSNSLRMVANPPACGQSQLLAFTWSEVGGSDFENLGDTAFQALEMRDATTLLLPAFSLGYPGSSYRFAATATSLSSLQSSSTNVEIYVEQGALRAVIQGGNFFQHTAGSDLVLDGSSSLDEDDITELPLRYEWWCSQNCTSMASFGTEAVASIPSQELVSGMVVSYDAPHVVVVAKEDSQKHDHTKKIVMYGAVDRASDLLWTQVQGDLDLQGQDWSTYFTTAQTGSNLVIRSGVLTGGSSYTFRLSAVDTISGNAGFAELSVSINAPPLGGHVEASPRVGTAAVDSFLLQSLDWTDDDLPLLYSFAYTKEETGLLSLSMLATEQPEWEGPLPMGLPAENYTIRISGQVSDSFGATAIATNNASGETVTARVTAWSAAGGGTTLSDTYAAALAEVSDIPGKATSTVRSYASLIVNEFNDTSQASAEEIELYQNLTTTMVESVADDFNALEFSPTTAGAVFDTLALVSGNELLLTAESQDELLSVSSNVLQRAVEDGSWDAAVFTPALELLENVMDGYNSSSSGGVVAKDELGEHSAETLPEIVKSMASLMESGLEDGEDSMIVGNTYVSILCLVTSETSAMSFDTRKLGLSTILDIALSAPARMTLKASAATASTVMPSCVYYNEESGSWDTAGLVMDSIATLTDQGNDGNGWVDMNVTCLSFHLSDFTISSDEIDAAFRPVTLTAGLDVVLKVREVSRLGFVLLLVVLILLVVARSTARMADAKNNLAQQLIGKTDAWYIATGEAHHHPTLMEVVVANSPMDAHQSHRRPRGRRVRRRRRLMLRKILARRFQTWGRRLRTFFRLVLSYHPWFAILSPSSSNLTLTREQLSLLIFAQILAHMMVEAAIIGNSSSYKIQAVQILVSLAVSMPASIIIPRLFGAISAPPPAPAKYLSDAVSSSQGEDWVSAKQMADAKTQERSRWLREPNPLMAVFRLISTISAEGSRVPLDPGRQRYVDGGVLARGTKLVWSGLRQISLDVVCIIAAALIGIDEQLDKALLSMTVVCCLMGLLCLDAVLATRGSSFAIMNFKMLFALVFARMVITAIQIVLSFHAVRNQPSSTLLYLAIFVVSVVKLVVSHKDELMPCMDGINQSYMSQVSMAKLYRSAKRSHQQVVTSANHDIDEWRRAAAIKIQTFVRMHQARRRTVRLQEVVVWHSPDVEEMRNKLKFRTYACLAIYTLAIAWINICYVATYDTPAIWSWVSATGLTILADILLRKPLTVLVVATFYAIRDNSRVPETAYVGIGRSQRPIGAL
eukprot:g5460.t1